MRILFFGMTGQFSVPPLATLLDGGADVTAVILPAPPGCRAEPPRRVEPSPLHGDVPPARTIVHLASECGLPVWQVGRLARPDSLALLRTFQPDVIAVACFSLLFPPQLLALPRFGCLNLHPSLLPDYRGPEPLFWQARNDARQSGVTLHFLDEGTDSGDIVAQTTIPRPDGITATELEHHAAGAGAELLQNALRQLARGESLPRRSQIETEARYFPLPAGDDFVIPTAWPARRAFNFVRGAEGWPLVIKADGQRFAVRGAKSYAVEQSLEEPFVLLGRELWVQFSPGVLRAVV